MYQPINRTLRYLECLEGVPMATEQPFFSLTEMRQVDWSTRMKMIMVNVDVLELGPIQTKRYYEIIARALTGRPDDESRNLEAVIRNKYYPHSRTTGRRKARK